jgi:hypothetical protein
MVNAGLVGIIMVFTIIGAAFGSYYITTSPISAQIASYQSVISSMSAHPSGAVVTTTITQFVVSVVTETNAGSTATITSTSTVTSVVTSTETELSNVTVLLRKSGTSLNYSVNWATFNVTGSTNTSSLLLPINPVYTGNQIFINTQCTLCTMNATLYIGTHLAAFDTGTNLKPLSMNYTF